jgi:hypothetical protein
VLRNDFCKTFVYFAEGATQPPVEVQGSGAGKSGWGPLTAVVMWAGRAWFGLELNDAAARPAKATSKAKARRAVFIFSNLIEKDSESCITRRLIRYSSRHLNISLVFSYS